MSSTVEGLSASLVREYLSRKGLKSTLAVLDQELPRNDSSISNRLALAKALRIEKLMKRNKEVSNHRTMVEVIVQSLLSPKTITSLTPPTASHDPETPPTKLTITNSSPSQKINPLTTSGTKHVNPLATDSKTTKDKRSTTEPLSLTAQSLLTSGNDGFKTLGNPITRTSLDSMDHSHLRCSSERSREDVSGDDRRHRMTHSTSESVVMKSTFTSSKTLQPRSQSVATKLGQLVVTPTTTGIPRDRDRGRRGHATTQGGHDGRAHHNVGVGSSNNRWYDGALKKTFKPSSTGDTKDGTIQDGMTIKDDERDTSGYNLLSDSPGVGEEDQVRHVTVTQAKTSRNITLHEKRSAILENDIMSHHQTPSVGGAGEDSLVCQDLEDYDFTVELPADVRDSPLTCRPPVCEGQPIKLETAKALRELLFGSAKGSSFNEEWRRQNFTFCDLPGLEYGLIQHKGGPCGLLACVQAYLLKHLMFVQSQNKLKSSPQPTDNQRTTALVSALADILWQAGEQNQAVIALPSFAGEATYEPLVSPSYRPDNIIEKVVLYKFTTKDKLEAFVYDKLSLLQDENSSSCIHFLLSVLLSRGLDRIQSDMDEGTNTLIGAHGYCTQEMVNLMLAGVAVSNVFDGQLELDTGGMKKHMLKGIPQQSEIGYLSLFEHYNSCTVGSHYKDPLYPIFVICSESHFSVLFSCEKRLLQDWQLERKFNLQYFDGLAQQEDEISLTIDNTGDADRIVGQDQLVSPIEHCIRTKWDNARVEWHGCDPIL